MKKPEPKTPIDETVQRRLDALERLIDTEYGGSTSRFEERTEIKMAQVNQWFSGYRALRDKALRRLEERTGKPKGYFDSGPKFNVPGQDSFIETYGHAATLAEDLIQVAAQASTIVQRKDWEEEVTAFHRSNGHSKNPVKNQPDELVIPQFDTGGAMGNGLLLRDQPGVIRGWSVNREWLSKNIRNHTGASHLCIVTGFGDSMKGMFNSGDPLVVDRGVTTIDFDAVYFFRVENEGFIKRLQRIPGEGIRVLSENKKYESWTIKPDMDFEVFGRVLKAWQGEEF